VTLVEGQAIVCPRKPGITFDQQVRNCTKPTGGFGGPHCDCVNLANAGQTAQVKKTAAGNEAGLTSTPVDFASLCAGDAALCTGSRYAASSTRLAGAIIGKFPSRSLCGH
jgi:hypothetical protein